MNTVRNTSTVSKTRTILRDGRSKQTRRYVQKNTYLMTRCTYCPNLTANGGGTCTQCLNRGCLPITFLRRLVGDRK